MRAGELVQQLKRHWLLLQRTLVLFPAPHGGSQPYVTLVRGRPNAFFWTLGALGMPTNMHAVKTTLDTKNTNLKLNFLNKGRNGLDIRSP